MRKSHVFAGLGLLVVQLACGDDGTSNEKPTSATLCVHLCARLHEAKCAGDAKTDCQATCLSTISSTPASCSSLVEAFATCAGMNTFTCDSNSEGSPPAACMQQFTAWQTCEAQATIDAGRPGPGPGGDAGNSLPVAHNDGGAVLEPVGGDAGTLNPGHVFGDAGVLDSDASTAGDAGGLPLICRPALNDDACDTCGENSCCAELAACDADCRTLGICVSDCAAGDTNCVQTCGAAATPGAIDQYNAILDCYDSKCAVACGG